LLETIIEVVQAHFPDAEVRIVPQLPASVESIDPSIANGFEGVMLKSLHGTYQCGKRSSHWLKVKTFSTADAFVVGYADGENANAGLVGSLDLAVIHPEGDKTVEVAGESFKCLAVAQVGNLTHDMRVAISAPDGSLKPEFYGTVIEFMAQGLGKNGRARHAHMVRLRPDKDPRDCSFSQIEVFPRV